MNLLLGFLSNNVIASYKRKKGLCWLCFHQKLMVPKHMGGTRRETARIAPCGVVNEPPPMTRRTRLHYYYYQEDKKNAAAASRHSINQIINLL